jgi:hypothetical protein
VSYGSLSEDAAAIKALMREPVMREPVMLREVKSAGRGEERPQGLKALR